MHDYFVFLIEIFKGFGDDMILHVGGFIEDNCSVDCVLAFVVSFDCYSYMFLAVEVGMVRDISHIRYNLQVDFFPILFE